MKKRILSLLLSLIMVLSLLPTTAWATGGHGQNTNPGSTTNTVKHIDIAVAITDPTNPSNKITLTDNLAKTIVIKDGNGKTYTPSSYSRSDDGKRNNQIRMNGDFPVGTRTNPVTYTLTLNLTISGIQYTVSVDANYWDNSNVCPGTYKNASPNSDRTDAWETGTTVDGRSNAGIDTEFGTPEATTKQVAVTKVIAGVAVDDLVAGKTFEFEFSQGNTVAGTASVTTTAGASSAGAIVYLPEGSYTVTEKTRSDYEGYTFKSTTYSSQTLTVGANGGSVTVTNTYEKEITTGNLTITKTVSGITNNDKEFFFTVADANGITVDGGTFTLKNGKTKNLTLPLGTYTVTESDADITGYTLETKYNGEVCNSYNVTLGNEADASAADGSRTCRPNPDPDPDPTPTTPTTPTTPSATVTVTNTYAQDWDTDKVNPASLTIKKLDGTTPLNGATFKLVASDVRTVTKDTAGEGDNKGIATFDNLLPGTYTLTEETPPTGYVKGDVAEWTVEVVKNTDCTKTITPDENPNNKYQKVYDCTVKVYEGTGNDKKLVATTDNCLPVQNKQDTINIAPTKKWENVEGITLPVSITVELYKNGTGTDNRVTLTPSTEGNVWTSEVGFANLPKYDVNGQLIIYTVKEVGYTILVDDESVYKNEALDGFTATEGNADNGYKITNTAKWSDDEITGATLTINKVDSEDNTKLLPDAEFTLYNGNTVYKTATSDPNGIATFTNLKPGDYTLKETDAPDGYKETSQEWAVTVTRNEQPTETKLVNGKFQNFYDCTVNVCPKVDGEMQEEPMTPDNNGGYTITNELAPPEYTATVDIEKIVKKTGGNVAPGEEEFVFVAYYKGTEKNMAVGEAKIITDGEDTYKNKMVLTVPASAFKLDNNGNGTVTLYVSEIPGSSAGWTYDPTVYTLVMTVENYAFAGIKSGDEIEFTPIIGSVPDGQGSDGASTNITLSFTNEFSQTKTPNRPHKPGKPITSVKTGDAGVAMYAMSGLLSLGGAALFMKKRKDEE